MNWDEFEKWGAKIAGLGAEYHRNLRDRPVRAQVSTGEIAAQLPGTPAEAREGMAAIPEGFERIVMPGLTHWQHPRSFA